MNFQGNDINDFVFLVVVCLATYTYSAFVFSKEPDPSTAFGISLNAMMAFLVTFGAFLVAYVVVLIAGVFGYAIIIVVYLLLIPKIVQRIISGNGKATV